MLKLGITWVSHHLHALKHSIKTLLKRPISSLMTMGVIAITLSLPCLFWVFSDNVERMTLDWKKGGHISLYLQSKLSAKEQSALLSQVNKMSGVGEATLKTPAEGLAMLQAQEGMQDIMQYLPENPLPSMIEVTPALTVDNPTEINHLFYQLKQLPGVAQAKVDLAWVNRLHAILNLASQVVHGLMLLLAAAVVFIIGNTLKLAVQNRHEEIQVLKLIGASDAFIIRPFLYTGLLYGLGGALLSLLLVNAFMISLTFSIKKLADAYQMTYPFAHISSNQTLLLLILAAILGWLAARLSAKRQLGAIEPI